MIESRIGFDDLEQVRTKEEWNDAGMKDENVKDENEKDENEKAQKDENEKDKNENELTEILPSPQHQTNLLRGRNR